MSELLGWVPMVASAVLGILYLWTGEGGSTTKAIGGAVFLLAVYLQFFSSYMMAGILLQVGLALTLEFWRRTF